jgi:hypothetical protein
VKWVFPDDQAVVAFGRKGSGKTALMRRLLVSKRHVVVNDSKRDEDWTGVCPHYFEADPQRLYQYVPSKPGRWLFPFPDEWRLDLIAQESHFAALWNMGPGIVNYCDEIGDVTVFGKSSPALARYGFRGRSAHRPLWGTSQRLHAIPLYVVSETDHVFLFEMGMAADRKRAEELVNNDHLPWHLLGDKRFLYIGPNRNVHGPYRLESEDII